MTACIKQNTKKYRLRGSPPYSAMDCKNSIQKGNDGLEYVSKPNKTGDIFRWIMVKNVTHTRPKNKTVKKIKVASQTNTKCVYKKKSLFFYRCF